MRIVDLFGTRAVEIGFSKSDRLTSLVFHALLADGRRKNVCSITMGVVTGCSLLGRDISLAEERSCLLWGWGWG